MAPRKAMRLPAVMAATGLSRPTIYRMMTADKFPKGTRPSVRVRVWYEDEIEAFQKGGWEPAELPPDGCQDR